MELVTHLPQTGGGWWGGGWFSYIREGFSGAWQRNVRVGVETALSHSIAWSCTTLIAFDIAKLRMKLVEEDTDGICEEVTNPAYSPVLNRPNHYQNRIQFLQSWVISKLTRGNTYVLKERNHRGGTNSGNVIGLYVLDPARVQPLVAPNGDVYYNVSADPLSGLPEAIVVPASEIIHDIYIAPYHPLCGISPIYAAAIAISHGLKILDNASRMFENGSQVSGVLTAPGGISEANAKRAQEWWESNFAGPQNVGKVAVLGDGLKFERMALTSVETELIKQLGWGDEKICSCYHVPAYMVGVGAMPNYNNIEALNQQYYSQCLQSLIESLELCFEEGIEVSDGLGIELDLEGLLRMDSATQMKTVTDGVKGSVMTPNEGRRKLNLPPLPGGDTIYMQQQNYSLTALAARDRLGPAPSGSTTPNPSPAAPALPPADDPADDPADEPADDQLRDFHNAVLVRMASTNWSDLAHV